MIDFEIPNPFESMTDEEILAHEARVRAEQAAQVVEEERERIVAARVHLVECGCPVKDLDRVIADEVEETKALRVVRRALSSGACLVILSGPPGTGKTTAAAWWLVQRRKRLDYVQTGPVRFVDAAALARWSRYDDGSMRELTRSRALVVDDLGIEYDDAKGAFRSLLDEVINARYAAQLPTLITTNLAIADRADGRKGFSSRYGLRILDRAKESGGFVSISGESMRGRR